MVPPSLGCGASISGCWLFYLMVWNTQALWDWGGLSVGKGAFILCNLFLLNHLPFCWPLTQEWKKMVYVILYPGQHHDQTVSVFVLSIQFSSYLLQSPSSSVSLWYLSNKIHLFMLAKKTTFITSWYVEASLHLCAHRPAFACNKIGNLKLVMLGLFIPLKISSTN